MNFGVIIGDSIAEGHPLFHGRLHTISDEIDLSKQNEEGQISYYLEKLTGMKVYNQGIGSQTTVMIKARWNRDVLGMNDTELNPSCTLPGIPDFIILVAGINDVWQVSSAEEIKVNFQYFIDSANESNIPLIAINLGPHMMIDDSKLSMIKEMNNWLSEKEKEINNFAVIDFYSLVNDPENDGYPAPGRFIDEVHPTGDTNRLLAGIIYDKCLSCY